MSKSDNGRLEGIQGEELRWDFSSVDSDEDGNIDSAEFESLMDSLGAEMTQEKLRIAFRGTDTDGNGKISCDEFIKWRCQ